MKTANIAIQLNHTREEELFEFQMSLHEIGIENPTYYGLIPFSDEISGAEEFEGYDAVVPFGTVKLIRLWQNGLLPANVVIFYDGQRFDQRTYAGPLKGLLLNDNAIYTQLSRVKDIQVTEDTFIKPTRDLKAFAGIIVEKGRTPGEEIYSRPQDSSLTDDEWILMAPLRPIVKEFRNFIVDNQIVDSSIYKIGEKITYEIPSAEERVMLQIFFDIVSARYSPIDTYVIDFALLETGEFVVIEYNCLNCAGMYCVDRRKVFQAIINRALK